MNAVQRNADPKSGSVILNAWLADRVAQREASKVKNVDTSGMSPAEFSDFVRAGYDTTSTTVNERTAMQVSTIYACVALIGGAIASIPLSFYQRAGEEREPFKPDEWWLLNEQPHPAWGAAVAWEFAGQSLLLQGDSFFRIHRNGPKIKAFEPIHPMTVTVRRLGDRLAYKIAAQPWAIGRDATDADIVLDQDDVLHIPGPGFDGTRGTSQLSNALRRPGSIALAADEYAVAFFRNSARPDFVLKTEATLTKDQQQLIRDQWDDMHKGTMRGHKPALLQGGLDVKNLGLTSADAQLLETRKFSVEDLCRIFGVPPFMVGHTEKSSSWGSGVEQMGIGFVKYTLQRHLVKFEQEINRKIFRTAARFCEFNTAGLERGDLKSRFEAYRIASGRSGEPGWMSQNQIRKLENMKADAAPESDQLSRAAAKPAPDKPAGDNPDQQGDTNGDQGDATNDKGTK